MDFNWDFTNWQDHPANRKYVVFKYHRPEQADFFENLLREEGFDYERFDDEEEERYLIAAPKSAEKRLLYLNNVTIGKFRNKFIPNKGFRLLVMLISAIVLALAFIGYFRAH